MNEKKIDLLQKKLHDALQKHDYVRTTQLMREIDVLRNESVQNCPLNLLRNGADKEKYFETLKAMNRVLVFADMLHGHCDVFASKVRELDSSATVGMVVHLEKAIQSIREALRAVDTADASLQESFDDLCAQVNTTVDNILYKHEAKMKKHLMEE